ncbi:MAG TPA: 4-hydroxythreonine-4-phosphate dehydrogenase PdxA [Candidatus Binataceae bacterium]|nr:4-hydroxythreonine-4-phosphate dehydrogenase PdxA [Candidatus Binataceae bacterium]
MTLKRTLAPLAISMGDPSGIGPEVILKAAAHLARKRPSPAIVVIGDLGAMAAAAERLGDVPKPYTWKADARTKPLSHGLPVLNPSRLSAAAIRPGRPSLEGAKAAYDYIVTSAKMALAGEASGLVTAPINKEWLNRAGFHFAGHSELLAKLSRTRLWRMMFAGDQLKLVLVTVHVGLARVSRMLTRDRVFETIRLIDQHLRAEMGIAKPRLAVLGFNPHAGENGLFGDEEIRAIEPAIAKAGRLGIDAHGPLPPDTAFIRHNDVFAFDAAVAMYHDQGLIALKTLEFDRAVNITLGLPLVRTSPDHGTAYDIAGTGKANADSMTAAIEYAWRAAQRRQQRALRAA